MTTIITISKEALIVSICGIDLRINKNELFKGLHTMKTFYENVVPEEKKDTLIGSGIQEMFDNIDKYKPFINKFIECWTFTGNAQSKITFNEDGTIDFDSSEQAARFDFKKYLQLMSDISDFESSQRESNNDDNYNLRIGEGHNTLTPFTIQQNSTMFAGQVIDLLQLHTGDDYDIDTALTFEDVEILNSKQGRWSFMIEDYFVTPREISIPDAPKPQLVIKTPISADHLLDMLEDFGLSNRSIHAHLTSLANGVKSSHLKYSDVLYICNKFDLTGKVNVIKPSRTQAPDNIRKIVIEPGIHARHFYEMIESEQLSTPKIVKYFQSFENRLSRKMYTAEIESTIESFDLGHRFEIGSDLED